MSWVDDNLVPEEVVLHRFKPSWTFLFQLPFLFPVIGQVRFLLMIVYILRSEVTITSRRLICVEQGLIRRDIDEINLANVEGLSVRQGVFDRIANKGKVEIGTGSGNREIVFDRVPNPMEFRRQAVAAIAERQQ